jgi:5'-methylthioadenosine phosphorylase
MAFAGTEATTLGERVGIIGGTSLIKRAGELDLERLTVETPHGPPSSPLILGEWGGREVALLVRHSLGHDIPPHRLNHHANMEALASAGVEKLVLIASAGSLSADLAPPAVLLADDFASPFAIPTFHDDRIVHITPRLSDRMRGLLAVAAERLSVDVVNGGTYVQTRGPRLETRAEVRALAPWGDVIGMTMASEATLALERGMEVAAVCSVDNMAHGLDPEPPEFSRIVANAERNWETIERVLVEAVPRF